MIEHYLEVDLEPMSVKSKTIIGIRRRVLTTSKVASEAVWSCQKVGLGGSKGYLRNVTAKLPVLPVAPAAVPAEPRTTFHVCVQTAPLFQYESVIVSLGYTISVSNWLPFRQNTRVAYN